MCHSSSRTVKDFALVGWGRYQDMEGAAADWLVQKWFAGNHSDIGGSYPETESRLSDIALHWMAKEAEGIPNGIIIDWGKLNLFPNPAGITNSNESQGTTAQEPREEKARDKRTGLKDEAQILFDLIEEVDR